MKVKEMVEILQGEVLTGHSRLEEDVSVVGAADMMSDILALSKPRMVVVTGHTSPQAVRTGLVTDLMGLIIVRGKQIPSATLELAQQNNFLIIKTQHFMYSCCGKLYAAGLRGADEQQI